MSKITGVHHIAIGSLDFDGSIRFYTVTLGLTLKTIWQRKVGRGALVEVMPGSYVEIFEDPPDSFDGTPVILHFALRTDDVHGMTERARSDGYAVRIEPFDVTLESTIGPMKLRLASSPGRMAKTSS
jgi:catechol 2,3-dioxygenase-like lactoylglutathione lyase family enzyme